MQNKVAKFSSRRRFILGGLGLTGALVVGWGFMPPRQRLFAGHDLPATKGEIALNGWVMIAPDGKVSVAMAKSEMGQGVTTALPMLVAEELDVPLTMVDIFQAPIDKIYGDTSMLADSLPFHPDDRGALKRSVQWLAKKGSREFGVMVTGGSSSMKDSWQPMREAGAAARARLIAAAAQAWKVPAAECTTDAGFVLHKSGKRTGYGELVASAAATKPVDFNLKDPATYKIIGKTQQRRDNAAKVDGSAQFGMDIKLPGMLYAAVAMCPVFGGKLQSFDAAGITSMPGVTGVVQIAANQAGTPASVAVIARSWWQAKQAVSKLAVVWDGGEHAKLSSAVIAAELKNKLEQESGFTYYQQGDIANGIKPALEVSAQYTAPFLAHAALEPVNCTAQFKDGKLTIWVPTQVPSIAVSSAAKAVGISEDDVTLHMTYLGGGFGRRLETDMVRQAVAIALQTKGAPVQLVWQREDDMAHDFYRPAAIAQLDAALDDKGNVVAYQSKSTSGAPVHQLMQRAFGLPQVGPDKTTIEGLFDLCYEFPNQHMAHVIVDSAVPLGTWRSVGHSHNAFFKESFIDEIAQAAGVSSIDFRRRLLKNHPRHLAVLNAAVAKAGQPAAGRAHGVALHQSFGSIVAEVAEVFIEGTQIHVEKITCAVDCGRVINPDVVRQQIESGVM
jgi:isoquinoline 1-oxidoreductase beta subunit